MSARTWLVHCLDGPGAAERRAAARAAHSARLAELRATPGEVELLVYGPLVAEGSPTGSAFLVAAPSRAAVAAFVRDDPFTAVGVWAAVQIHELAVSANSPVPLVPPVPERVPS